MSGWDLSCGKYNNNCQNEDDFWAIINNFLSNKTNKTTSYKYCFFKAILDNVFNINDDLTISYQTIFERFAEIYWNLVVKYKLCQIQSTSRFAKSSVEILIENFVNEYNIDNSCSFDALRDDLKKDIVSQISSKCSLYVVGAFYEDTKQAFYSFDKKTKIIEFKDNVLKYFIKFKNILTKLNYFEWVKFLEKTNNELSVIALAEKLDYSSKRDNLSFYRDFLTEIYGETKCFYCGKNLHNKGIEMDHFIPWSFVKDDKIWNLVISCRQCNNSKRDKMAPKELIEKLKEQNTRIMQGKMFKSIQREFMGYNDNKIDNMYSSAIFNGFDEYWKPED